jgi:hypothetical protein
MDCSKDRAPTIETAFTSATFATAASSGEILMAKSKL